MSQRLYGSEYFTITELAERNNVTFRTLRFYEERGLLCPQRVGLQRFYTVRDEIKLRLILLGAKFGFALSEIKCLIDEHVSRNSSEPKSMVELLEPETIVKQIGQLEAHRARIDSALAELRAAAEDQKLLSAS